MDKQRTGETAKVTQSEFFSFLFSLLLFFFCSRKKNYSFLSFIEQSINTCHIMCLPWTIVLFTLQLLALDTGNLAVLTLLDLSAVFDSVDHETLLRRLQMWYDLGGVVINWFVSYLTCCTQYVWSSANSSTPSAVLYGVPQGLVLRPILFLLYTADLLRLIRRHHLHPHAYADDTQIPKRYLSVCLSAWMTCQHGWWQIGCSSTLPRPRCSGVRLLVASFRSQLALSASVTHLCCRPLRSGTLQET